MTEESARDQARDRVEYVQSGRPRFFADPVHDQMLAMVTALLGEVCVLRERLDTIERLASERGLWSADDVERFRPDRAAEQARVALREGALARVYSVLNEEIARMRHESDSRDDADGS